MQISTWLLQITLAALVKSVAGAFLMGLSSKTHHPQSILLRQYAKTENSHYAESELLTLRTSKNLFVQCIAFSQDLNVAHEPKLVKPINETCDWVAHRLFE